ncbi:MAG TPA: hypothetical protein VEU96_32255 [Bryobacteraceae bacterium]|nr:hypothetical protein [Bryobacteraceae bacterium]
MPDNLLPPQPEKPARNPWLSWPMAVVVLVGGGYLFALRSMESRMINLHFIYHQTANGWERVRTPAGYPDMLRVTQRGTVWARTWGKSSLARFDGKAWRYFNSADIGASTSYKDSEFALDGEEVWAPTEIGVIHFDGRGWQTYKEAASSEGAIVAGGGEVWVIDHTGKLSHFAAGKWTSQKLALEGVAWTEKPDEGNPELARTPNGNVWLVWQGLWRFDGSSWSRVKAGTDGLENTRLIGAAGDRVWLSDNAELRSVSMDGKHWSLYTAGESGMKQPLIVSEVAAAGGRTWFATLDGLVEFDGKTWRTLPMPGKEVSGVRRVAVGPGGELWVIGVPTPQTLQTFRKVLPFTLFVPVVIIGLLTWIVWRSGRRKLQQHRLLTQAVQHATGEVPDELQKGEQAIKWGGWVTTVGTAVGTIVGYAFLRRVWPHAPVWWVPVIAAALHMGLSFQQSLTRRKPRPSDPIGPGAPSRYDWGKTGRAVAGGAFVILLWNADRFPALSFMRGWMFWAVLLSIGVYEGLATSLMNGALKKGQYDRALNIIRLFNFYNPSGVEALRAAGHVQLLAGRYREAEYTLRGSIASAQARESYGSALEFLGDALMEQGRYDEAMRSYEAALYAFSWRRRPYRGMAEMLLRQGKQTEQALEWIEKIVDFAGLSFTQRKSNGRPQDDYWALKAWALARMGRGGEVAAAIDEALKATDKNVLPDLATTYYRAGMAMQALGNESAARDYFQRAVDLDPAGRRGTLAKAAMRTNSVWEKVG